jgi:hypothetical protein
MKLNSRDDMIVACIARYAQIIQDYQFLGNKWIDVVIIAEIKSGLRTVKSGFPVGLKINAEWELSPPEARFLSKPYWLQFGADWHVSSDLSICYEYPRHWEDHFAQLKIGTRDKADCAAQWIVNGISNVIRGQADSYRLGVNVWTEMPETAWPHGDVLAKEMYFKENPNLRGAIVKHSQN